MTLRTINNIEVSAICNNACRYCPASEVHKHRPVGLMTMDTFEHVLEWIRYFVRQGTQGQVNMYGVGESTLNPLLPDMIRAVRDIVPYRHQVHLNTNANWVDKTTTYVTEKEIEYALSLKNAGITQIDITAHNHFNTAKAWRIFGIVEIPSKISFDVITRPNNWGGQVDWFEPIYDAGFCPWIYKGQSNIMWDGGINQCCLDAFGNHIMGTVYDEPHDIEAVPYELCKSCHHKLRP